MARANIKNRSEINPMTYGFWRLAWILVPDMATTIPAAAYVKDMLRT